jgi:hypothetical protein
VPLFFGDFAYYWDGCRIGQDMVEERMKGGKCHE